MLFIKLATTLRAAGGEKRLCFHETLSRVTLFNFRHLCLPLTKHQTQDAQTGKRQIISQAGSRLLQMLLPREEGKWWDMAVLSSPRTELWILTVGSPCHDLLIELTVTSGEGCAGKCAEEPISSAQPSRWPGRATAVVEFSKQRVVLQVISQLSKHHTLL